MYSHRSLFIGLLCAFFNGSCAAHPTQRAARPQYVKVIVVEAVFSCAPMKSELTEVVVDHCAQCGFSVPGSVSTSI